MTQYPYLCILIFDLFYHHNILASIESCPSIVLRSTHVDNRYRDAFGNGSNSVYREPINRGRWVHVRRVNRARTFRAPSTLITYSWIDHGLQSGPTLAFSLWLSYFKTKTSFGFLIKKNRGHFLFFFFKKSKNELVRPKMMFLAIFARIQSFSNNSDM